MTIHGRYRSKIPILYSLIFGETLIFLTPHMFSFHKWHSLIFSRVHFFAKKSIGVSLWYWGKQAFMVVLGQKCRLYASHRSLPRGSYSLPHTCLLTLMMFIYNCWRSFLSWKLIFDKRLLFLTSHMFPSHRPVSLIFGEDHFFVKSISVRLRYCRKRLFMAVFWPKIPVICPFIFGERLLFLTTHMFSCCK